MSTEETQDQNTELQDQQTGEVQQPEVDTTSIHDAPPVRRKRGRPSNAERAAASGSPEPVKSTPGAKRGPKPKGAKKQYTTDDISVMGRQLCGVHMMVAQITRIPEAQISEDEGTLLAKSIIDLADQYDLSLDGKTGASLQLLMTAAMIYGPRALMVQQRMKQQRADNVVATDGQPVQ